LLGYGDVTFKSALERFFYFSAARHPASLMSLLEATAGWRRETADSPLTALYDDLAERSSHRALSNATTFMKNVLRRCRYLLGRTTLQTRELQPPRNALSRIGFFVINPRFVQFFKEYAEVLGKEKILFFCTSPEAAAIAASMGYEVTVEKTDLLENRKIRIPVTHPLFDAYWTALQSYLRLHGTIAVYQPATLVFAEGTSMEDQLAGLAAKQYGIPTIRLQSGRAGVLHSGYRRMAFDKMLCWGEGFVDRYRQYTPDAEYVITGSPVINVASDRPAFNGERVTCVIFTQPINRHLSEAHYKALTSLATNLLTRYNGMHILVRKHPLDICRSLDALAERYPGKVTLADYRTWPLQRVMSSADIAVGFYSTTLSEAAACGVIPIILKLEDGHSVFPFPERYGAAIEAPNVDAVMQWITRLLNDPGEQAAIKRNMHHFASRFFGPQDGNAIERTVNCMIRSAGEH